MWGCTEPNWKCWESGGDVSGVYWGDPLGGVRTGTGGGSGGDPLGYVCMGPDGGQGVDPWKKGAGPYAGGRMGPHPGTSGGYPGPVFQVGGGGPSP